MNIRKINNLIKTNNNNNNNNKNNELLYILFEGYFTIKIYHSTYIDNMIIQNII